ncbi:hypothetical protein L21SP2_0113 [Salinispira pacifica]|uniref:Uncharacterized protein n=1 Tax=Salinispira pacifica TaxID=1307761 RepID=V5WCQ8_9SPIO|nr:hypothetical protein L21SP2_0113 [Salinispira pacifica]
MSAMPRFFQKKSGAGIANFLLIDDYISNIMKTRANSYIQIILSQPVNGYVTDVGGGL